MQHQISVGLTAEASTNVTDDQTAVAFGSGEVEVYATPAMIALMENAAINAIEGLLPEGYSTVGIHINVEHLSATPRGEQVRARAEVVAIEGNRVSFNVSAWDERELIGDGTHTRFIIDVQRFMKRLSNQGES